MVLSYFDDDGFDLDQGYVGNAQFGLVIANPTQSINADNLFEMDGDDDILDDENNVSLDGRPITYAQIANFTLIGWDDSDHGMQLRQGFGGDIYNTIVANIIGDTGLRIDSSGTANAAAAGYPDVNSQARVNAGTLNLISTSWYGVTTPNHRQIDLDVLNNNAAVAPGSKNNVIGPLSAASFGNNGAFGDVLQKGNPINPVPFSTAVNQNVANPGNNFFEVVNYRGAFERNPTKLLWTSNWTALNKLGELVSRGNGQN